MHSTVTKIFPPRLVSITTIKQYNIMRTINTFKNRKASTTTSIGFGWNAKRRYH